MSARSVVFPSAFLRLGLAVAIATIPVLAPTVSAIAEPSSLGAPASSTESAAPTAQAEIKISGSGCAPGAGVTVAVDFSPASEDLTVACAPGDYQTLEAAIVAAGFELDLDKGTLCTVNKVLAEPKGCGVWPGAYWSVLVSTKSGSISDSTPGTGWTPAATGISEGPAKAGLAALLQIQPFVENWAGPKDDKQPLIALADLTSSASPTEVSDSSAPASTTDTAQVVDPNSAPADVAAAAGWIGRQLAATGDNLDGDWSVTIDSIIALAAAGVGKDQIDASSRTLWQSGETYIGSAQNVKDKWGQIAKTALALQIAGLDPTNFPDGNKTRDLLQELQSTLNADGSFGATDFPYLHAFAVFALARTSSGVPESAVTWLSGQQCATPDHANFGAYGFGNCDEVDIDGTSMSIQALLAAGLSANDPAVGNAVNWILENQDQSTGGLPSSFGGLNTNSTGIAGQALLGAGSTEPAAAAAKYLGSLQVSCEVAMAHPALTAESLGAIGYDQASWTDGLTNGLDKANIPTWRQATTQAILGLGLPAFGAIDAKTATAELPSPDCDLAPESSAAAESSAPTEITAGSETKASSTSVAASEPGTSASWWIWIVAAVVGLAVVTIAILMRRRHNPTH